MSIGRGHWRLPRRGGRTEWRALAIASFAGGDLQVERLRCWPLRLWHFYRDGFRAMTLGRTLWRLLLLKLFLFFALVKPLFFPDLLHSRFATEAQRAGNVLDRLTGDQAGAAGEFRHPVSRVFPNSLPAEPFPSSIRRLP